MVTKAVCMCRYIERPLLIQQRKFHLRVYVLCVGSLKAYVYDQVLPYAVILAGSVSMCISESFLAQSNTRCCWCAKSQNRAWLWELLGTGHI